MPFINPAGMKRLLAEAGRRWKSASCARRPVEHAGGSGDPLPGAVLMGRFVIVIGTQWGDEGKGKIVDLLTERAAAVARFQGGHNAGHTLVIGGQQDHPVADSVGHPARGRAVPDRQRRGAVAARRCSARPAMLRRTGRAGIRAAAHLAGLSADSAVARGAGSGARGGPRRQRHRYHRPRHRSGLRGQGGAARGARRGPVPARPVCRQARRGARLSTTSCCSAISRSRRWISSARSTSSSSMPSGCGRCWCDVTDALARPAKRRAPT